MQHVAPDTLPSGRPTAAVWRRMLASVLDMLVIFWLQFAIAILLAGFGVTLRHEGSPEPWGSAFVGYVVYTALFVTYEAVYLVKRGQTPGQELLKVKVVDAASGESLTRQQVLRRGLLPWALRLVPGGWSTFGTAAIAATALPALADPARRRTLPDLLGGTRVVSYDADVEEGPRPVVRRPGARRGMFNTSGWTNDDDD